MQEFRALFERGVPYAEIGRRLGMTKNAVIGRAYRLGLVRRAPGEPTKTTVDRLDALNAELEEVLAKPVRRIPDSALSQNQMRALANFIRLHNHAGAPSGGFT
jgi:hypothetical protein